MTKQRAMTCMAQGIFNEAHQNDAMNILHICSQLHFFYSYFVTFAITRSLMQ